MKRLFVGLLSVLILFSAVCPVMAVDESGISAKSAVLMLADTGEIIWSKNGDVRLPMASTTKIMTAIVVLEAIDDLSQLVRVSPDACGVEGSSVYLTPEEPLTVEQLLFALLLESANDAAVALAVEVAGDVPAFADMMNCTAERLGLHNSHFVNPHGLDHEDHYTTAADLAAISAYALNNEDFVRIVSCCSTAIPLNGVEGGRPLTNHNRLLKEYDGAIGVKTGFTKKCGRCLVSAAERDGLRLVAVTLSAPDDWNDHKTLLDMGFDSYKSLVLAEPGSISIDVPVVNSSDGTKDIHLSNSDSLKIVLPADSPAPTMTVEAPRFIFSPVDEGQLMGEAVFHVNGNEVGRVYLFAMNGCAAPKKPSLIEKFLDLYR